MEFRASMNKVTKLVNVSDSSDSDSSSGDSPKGKVEVRCRSKSKEKVEVKRERSRSKSRERSPRRERSRDRSRERRDRERRRERHHSPRRRRRSPSPRRRRSPHRRPPRRSPPRPSRSHKTMTTLERLGIELKSPSETADLLPSYYNRSVDPAQMAQRLAKRKLIWGSKSESDQAKQQPSLWQGATFSDNKVSAKFKRLMGIKEQEGGVPEASSQQGEGSVDLIRRQQELFSSMEIQYEAARQATHTQRGVGLGFGAALHPH